ncbi:hypothetical protein ACFVT8_10520 [Lysinibacillus sp. NPDC058147]|uniref:hypothetical protein n=1 Tax=unclassified Lysinibacillus TaxID=2636778 RepID=UPI0036D7AB05
MSRLGQQMFFERKRSANAASAKCFCLCESEVQRSDNNSTDVGHEGVITGCEVLAFVPLLLIPKESPQSTYLHNSRFNKSHSQLGMNQYYVGA